MTHPLTAKWLAVIGDLDVVLTSDPVRDGLDNISMFSADDAQVEQVSVAEIDFFILEAFRMISRKVEGQNAWFYAWYDEMAGTLRCSVVDVADVSGLPFRCQVEIVDTPSDVSASALAAIDPSFIRFEDLVEVSWDETASELGGASSAAPVLAPPGGCS